MKFVTGLVLAAVLAATPLAAQGPAVRSSRTPVTDVMRSRLARASRNLVTSAELLPADQYGFQPTPAQMTFAEIIVRVVQTNVALCAAATGEPPRVSVSELMDLTEGDDKDELVDAIRDSFEYCREGFADANDARLAAGTAMYGRPTGLTRAGVMITLAADWAAHYSTAAAYLRLNGIVPPASEREPSGE